MMMGQRADEKTLNTIRKEYGFDQPKSLQYLKKLNDLFPLSIHNYKEKDHYFYLDTTLYRNSKKLIDLGKYRVTLKAPFLGKSYQSDKPVSEIIRETFPNTFILAITSILFASFIGIVWGIFAALKKDSFFDRLSIVVSSLGMSLPSFFAAIIIGWIFAYLLGDITGLNLTGNLYEIDDFGRGYHLQLQNLILPSLTLGIRPLAIVLQLTRNSLLDVLSQDYIRTAKAKGLSNRRIIIKHALKNSLNPVITAVSGWFASMMAGVVFVEYIFGWKGLGYIIVDALNKYDMPVVSGCILTIAIIFIAVNILVDITYRILDPKLRYTEI